MGWFSSLTDNISDAFNDVSDAVTNVGGAVAGSVSAAGGAVAGIGQAGFNALTDIASIPKEFFASSPIGQFAKQGVDKALGINQNSASSAGAPSSQYILYAVGGLVAIAGLIFLIKKK